MINLKLSGDLMGRQVFRSLDLRGYKPHKAIVTILSAGRGPGRYAAVRRMPPRQAAAAAPYIGVKLRAGARLQQQGRVSCAVIKLKLIFICCEGAWERGCSSILGIVKK